MREDFLKLQRPKNNNKFRGIQIKNFYSMKDNTKLIVGRWQTIYAIAESIKELHKIMLSAHTYTKIYPDLCQRIEKNSDPSET